MSRPLLHMRAFHLHLRWLIVFPPRTKLLHLPPPHRHIQAVDHTQTMQRGITLGWMIFCMIVMSFWSAGLTAQLVRGGSFTAAITWEQLQATTPSQALCVEEGADNQKYFQKLKEVGRHKYKVEGKPSTDAQIEATMNGACHGSEITQEVYNKYPAFQSNGKPCGAVLAAQPIARRARGMMAKTSSSCLVTGINALIHEYSTRMDCYPEAAFPHRCNLFTLWAHHFQEPKCLGPAKEGDEGSVSLDWEVFESPLWWLLVLTAIGAVFTAIGRGRMTLAIPKCGTLEDCLFADKPSAHTLCEHVFLGKPRKLANNAGNRTTRWCHRTFGHSVAFGCDSILECCLVKMCVESKEARKEVQEAHWGGKKDCAAFQRMQYGKHSNMKACFLVGNTTRKGDYETYDFTQCAGSDTRPDALSEEQKRLIKEYMVALAEPEPDGDVANKPGPQAKPPHSKYPEPPTENQIWFGRWFETANLDRDGDGASKGVRGDKMTVTPEPDANPGFDQVSVNQVSAI